MLDGLDTSRSVVPGSKLYFTWTEDETGKQQWSEVEVLEVVTVYRVKYLKSASNPWMQGKEEWVTGDGDRVCDLT